MLEQNLSKCKTGSGIQHTYFLGWVGRGALKSNRPPVLLSVDHFFLDDILDHFHGKLFCESYVGTTSCLVPIIPIAKKDPCPSVENATEKEWHAPTKFFGVFHLR